MGMSVKRLLAEFDSHELGEWMAFYKLEPWGEERADIRAAIVARTVASQWAKEVPDLEDFMPFLERDPQSLDDMKSVLGKARRQALPMGEQ